MKILQPILSCAVLLGLCASAAAREAKDNKCHLFILSGQSNMAGLKPEISFTPAVEKAFADDEVLVVKDAMGGQPIRRWYKNWKPAEAPAGESSKAKKDNTHGDLYDRLMKKVVADVGERKPDSITFVWMQGERDAKEKHGEVYGASFRGILKQLQSDLGREDINFVIGRLSDFDNDNKRYPHWTVVRDAQVKLAEDDARGEWVDTDDLNGKGDGLHYNAEGYKTLGKRFAEKAITLVNAKAPPKKES